MLQLNYKEYGSSGPVMIILHGFLGSLDNWHSLATKWGDAGLHVFAVDQRNHGKSPHTDHHSIELMSGDLSDFMKEHGIEKAIVLGHSMGGKTAMHFALQHPEMTEKLIVADMAPRAYKPGAHDDVFSAIAEVDLGSVQTRKEAEEAMKAHLGDYGTRQFILKSLDRSEDGYKWKFNIATLQREYNDVIGAIESESTYGGPSLFLKGSQSLYIKDEDMQRIKELFPQAVLKQVDNAGHWLHADQPEAFFNAVLDFVNS